MFILLCVRVCVGKQVQSELSVKTEKLHGEESSHHQLSEDFEQVHRVVELRTAPPQ